MSKRYCPICTADMKEYVGFNARAGDPNNPWDCTNKNCSPKTTEATHSDDLFPEYVIAPDGFEYEVLCPSYSNTTPYEWAKNNPGRMYAAKGGHLYYIALGPNETIWRRLIGHPHLGDVSWEALTPTQSEPDRSCEELAATTASSRQQHTQGYGQAGQAVGANGLLPLAPDLSLDDPDQCTLQQQGSGLPPKLSMPKTPPWGSQLEVVDGCLYYSCWLKVDDKEWVHYRGQLTA